MTIVDMIIPSYKHVEMHNVIVYLYLKNNVIVYTHHTCILSVSSNFSILTMLYVDNLEANTKVIWENYFKTTLVYDGLF